MGFGLGASSRRPIPVTLKELTSAAPWSSPAALLAGVMPTLILVVDDDPSILALVVEVLCEEGYEVATAKRAQHALDLFAGGEVQPPLLVQPQLGGL